MVLGPTTGFGHRPDLRHIPARGHCERAHRGGAAERRVAPDFTVAETVEIVASLHGRLDDVGTVLHATGLTGLAGRKVSRCSGGEQQRIKFALATPPTPDLLILDEPTAGMDVDARRAFWADDAHRRRRRAHRPVRDALPGGGRHLRRPDRADRGADVVADGPTADIRTMAGRRVVSAIVDDDEIARPHRAATGRRSSNTAVAELISPP